MQRDRARNSRAPKPARWLVLAVFCFVVAALSAGCSGVDAPIIASDAGDDASDVDVESDADTAPEDSGEDVEDIDTTPDPCPVCCSGTGRCGVGGVREICNADGTAYEPDPCDEGSSCTAGTCEPDPICTPGESRCLDPQTQITCRATGLAYRTDACTGDQVCVASECRSGLANGVACTNDSECAGGSCLSVGATSYCSNSCVSSPCGDSEVCWNVDGIAHQEGPHCLEGCQVSCAREDMSCVALRTEVDGAIAWASGCVPDAIKPIGGTCSSDSECASELCRLDYFSNSDDDQIGYCTRQCEAGGCPEGSACVILSSGQWCQPRCSNGVCPLDPSGNNLRIGCNNRQVVGSIELARVCIDD